MSNGANIAQGNKETLSSPETAECLQLLYDMYNTYNMGVGMSIVVPKEEVETSLEILKAQGLEAYVIGHIEAGDEKIVIC